VLFYHSDCIYSENYKQKFVNYYNNPTIGSTYTVGIVDCKKDKNFCSIHQVNSYPGLQKIYENFTSEELETQFFLGNLIGEYKTSDEYLGSLISQKLKN
jgi:hypothetical protein